ncbi:MAG: hypothetical protein CR975_02510 [Gammaproteobacteria bacterium]|nr:MAG: hypothetical protein CR975_02510 [Gammaproteobacteria bacterium]
MSIKHSALFIAILSITNLATAENAEKPAPQPAIPAAPKTVPGQCHALVNVPAKLISTVEEMPSKGAGEVLEITPAKYEWVEKQVPISEEEKTVEIIPATYKTVEEKIVVEPESKEYEVIPAQYKDVSKKVMVKPAMRVWRKSSGGAASLAGEVMRLIEVPAQYVTVKKKEMVTAPQIREIVIPAKYATVKKKIIDKPASTREVVIPAEYKTIRVRKLVEKPKELRKPTKVVMQKINRYEIAEQAQLKWQRVPCDSDLNEANIIAIQKGLRAAGYDVTADGKFGKGSREALEKFQEKKGLAKGAITVETMKALGVNID